MGGVQTMSLGRERRQESLGKRRPGGTHGICGALERRARKEWGVGV